MCASHAAMAVILIGSIAATAQQIGGNAPQGKDETFKLTLNSQLVIEQVVVKDKSGKFVSGLTAKDFTVTEDGNPQTVKICEQQHFSDDVTPLPPQKPEEENITVYKKLTHTQFSSEPADGLKYKDRRLIALYFDMTAMPPQDQARALNAAMTFVRTQMTEADMISILEFAGGSVAVLQDFTADRNRLLSILETLIVGEGQGTMDSIDDASSADTGAAFGQDDSEFNIFNTDRQLSALQTTANMLAQMREKKELIYFASGLRLNGVDNMAQLHATIDAAVRAGVSFWPVDARGLVASAPLGDATQAAPGNQSMYTGAAAMAVSDRFQRSQDTMYSLAADTGGKALFDNNDLTRGIVQAQHAITDYYIVGYYTTNTARNGKFRRVKINLGEPRDANLAYREGYYASKEFAKFTAADKERQLEDALMLGDPITDLTIAMEIDYFQLNRAEYFVPIMVKIPGRELALAKKFGAEHTVIDFICEIKDVAGGFTVQNVRDNVDIKLTDATAQQLAKVPIEYDSGYTLLPGRYSIKFLARDDETGRMGTYQTEFTIPNLNKETVRVPISSVVLSSQRVNTRDALYNATRGKKQTENDAKNPLVQEGLKLIPSVTRVFNTAREMNVYLQAYAAGGQAAAGGQVAASPQATAAAQAAGGNASGGATVQPVAATTKPSASLIAFVTLYKDGKKAFESKPLAATPEVGSRLGVTPFSFHLGLGDLAAGRYDCQISVLDPAGKRVVFWVNPVMLVR